MLYFIPILFQAKREWQYLWPYSKFNVRKNLKLCPNNLRTLSCFSFSWQRVMPANKGLIYLTVIPQCLLDNKHLTFHFLIVKILKMHEVSCQKFTFLSCTTKFVSYIWTGSLLQHRESVEKCLFFPWPSGYNDSLPCEAGSFYDHWVNDLESFGGWMHLRLSDAVGKMEVMERAWHCRLSNDVWQPSGMWCRWKGYEYVSGTKIRTTEIPHRFPTGHWDLVSVFLEIQMVLQSALSCSDHLDPKETALAWIP